MSYSNPVTAVYSYGEHDFGAASETFRFKGPAGKKGYLVDVNVSATEVFTNTTTEGAVKVGSAEAGAQYVNMGLGTLADKATQNASDTAADVVLRDLPADTAIWVQLLAPTGGTPSGKGFVQIIVNWY